MDCKSTRIPYRQTGAFTKIALDYIDQAEALKPFFAQAPTLKGIQKTIEARKEHEKMQTAKLSSREILVQELKKQYGGIETNDKVNKNINSLLSPDTFTITTAHQSNIFTGPLYFIYKIIHAIKLADYLNESLTGHHFVPVYYIGSEDGDLDELNNITISGEKLTWNTKQTGAVGRMLIDKALIQIINQMEGQLSVLPHGDEIIDVIRKYYKEGATVQDATFQFVNYLFAAFGLVVLQPDNAILKSQMISIIEDDLLHQSASEIVQQTAEQLVNAGYKIQANPREINLFYLKDDLRERIVFKNDKYFILNSQLSFSKEQLLAELKTHPERFSPNVILRGLYQEMILPNLVFIGGGGEMAYWLQLKELFTHYKIPFPVLVLRNSFLLIEKKWQEKIEKLQFEAEDFFMPENDIANKLVLRDTKKDVKLNGGLSEADKFFESIKSQAGAVDVSLIKHVDALKAQSLKRLQELEKKMMRAEKRKFIDQQRQIQTINEHLFPRNGLQERIENITYYYAARGKEIIHHLYKHSLQLEQEFVILTEK